MVKIRPISYLFCVFFFFGAALFLLNVPKAYPSEKISNDQLHTNSPQNTSIYVIPIKGDVEPSMAAFLSRAFRDASKDKNALFVLDMDTFGGRVDTALQIVDSIVNSAPGRTIAFVSNKAISAGALIAIACSRIVMRQNTTIGDCAPISLSTDGAKMLGEKFQSPLRAKFRTLARLNGYPAILAESMVSADIEVYEFTRKTERIFLSSEEYANLTNQEKKELKNKKTLVAKGKLLTMDDSEALALNFSTMTAENIESMLAQMGIKDFNLVPMQPNWSESLGGLINKIAPILLMIGLTGLYTEIKSPGFGFPGIIGICSLALLFFNQYIVGLTDHTEFMIITLGFILLALEIFVIPGFGLTGALGIFCISVGIILTFQDFVLPSPELPWQKPIFIKNCIIVFGSTLSAMLCSLLMLRYLVPSLGNLVDGPYLKTSMKEFHADSMETKKVKIGDTGISATPLRPAGKMQVADEIIDVVSQGEFIEHNTNLEIVAIEGNRIIVKENS